MEDHLRSVIRKKTLERRQGLSKQTIKEKSYLISKQLREFDLYRYAKHIALYMDNKGEVSLKEIWNTAPLQGKFCYFPVLDDDKLIFLPATPNSHFEKNKYGILEPQVSRKEAIPLDKLDLVLMPLVAFDVFGNRIGMGKGYYDKTFEDIVREHRDQTHLLGIAYEFQKYDVLPFKTWDVPLDGVVTEKRVYWSRIR